MKPKGRKKGSKFNKLIFENERYRITEIPLNYQIDIKLEIDGNGKYLGKRVKLLPQQFYSSHDRGLDEAKATAEAMIKYKLEE